LRLRKGSSMCYSFVGPCKIALTKWKRITCSTRVHAIPR
jgi:hypothetical protein